MSHMPNTQQASVSWRKSSYSGNENCVEVADYAGTVLIRDSKDLQGPALAVDPAAFQVLVQAVKNGEFDLL